MLLLFFSILSFAEVIRHWYIINRLHRSPNKAISFTLRFAAGCVFALSPQGDIPFGVVAGSYLIVDWYIHDYVLNLLRGVRPIWYLNSKGPIDRIQNNYPNAFVWFVWKTILLIGFLGMYYINTYPYY